MMVRKRCARNAPGAQQSCSQRRIFANVTSAEGYDIIPEFWNGVIELEVKSPVCIAVGGTADGDCSRSAFHMHPVGTDFQTVIGGGSLPGQPPIGSNTPDVHWKRCPGTATGIRLRSANVLGTINRSSYIEMLVPHAINSEPGHVLG